MAIQQANSEKESKTPNLGSTVNDLGEEVTMIFHYLGDMKRTRKGMLTHTINEGEMLKIMRTNGSMLIINKNNLCETEIIPKEGVKFEYKKDED